MTDRNVLATLRRLLLAILLIGLAGTFSELWLMGHYEDSWQLAPLVSIGLALATTFAVAIRASAPNVRVFQVAMLILIASGIIGAVLHYRANMEFQLEMDPGMSGLELFLTVLHAKAPPALAPGNMALLGLLGLASVFGMKADFVSRS